MINLNEVYASGYTGELTKIAGDDVTAVDYMKDVGLKNLGKSALGVGIGGALGAKVGSGILQAEIGPKASQALAMAVKKNPQIAKALLKHKYIRTGAAAGAITGSLLVAPSNIKAQHNWQVEKGGAKGATTRTVVPAIPAGLAGAAVNGLFPGAGSLASVAMNAGVSASMANNARKKMEKKAEFDAGTAAVGAAALGGAAYGGVKLHQRAAIASAQAAKAARKAKIVGGIKAGGKVGAIAAGLGAAGVAAKKYMGRSRATVVNPNSFASKAGEFFKSKFGRGGAPTAMMPARIG